MQSAGYAKMRQGFVLLNKLDRSDTAGQRFFQERFHKIAPPVRHYAWCDDPYAFEGSFFKYHHSCFVLQRYLEKTTKRVVIPMSRPRKRNTARIWVNFVISANAPEAPRMKIKDIWLE